MKGLSIMLFSKQIGGFVAVALMSVSLGTAATPAFASMQTQSGTMITTNAAAATAASKKDGWHDTGKTRIAAGKVELQKGSYKVGKKTYKYRAREVAKTQKQQAYYKNGKKLKTRWVAGATRTSSWEYFNERPINTAYANKWMSASEIEKLNEKLLQM